MKRRLFLASSLLVPYTPKRVYSFLWDNPLSRRESVVEWANRMANQIEFLTSKLVSCPTDLIVEGHELVDCQIVWTRKTVQLNGTDPVSIGTYESIGRPFRATRFILSNG